jgi:carbon-monoxide dehydrogenase large subunit
MDHPVTALPAPIGVPLPRPDAKRHVAGRGRFVDDIRLARTAHIAFLRSPHAHARIVSVDAGVAASMPGVLRVLTGRDVAALCKPYVGVLAHMAGMKSAPQHPLAIDRAVWQGEPVVAVVAETRARAEDAVQAIEVDWEELPPLVDPDAAAASGAPVLHPALGDNLAYERTVDTGGVDAALAAADAVADFTMTTARHTACSLEARSLLADFDPSSGRLTVWHSTQVPYMMQWLLAHHFGLAEPDVRVIAPDVGGSFGLKIHVYGDDLTTVAAALLLGRPVKFVADRMESFIGDFHARGHRVRVRMGVQRCGDIVAIDVDDIYGVGPFSCYPRGSANEGKHVLNLTGAPYRNRLYRGRTRAVFQNKPMYGQYRSVGHPIVCAATEGTIDVAARAIGMDPADFRRRNYLAADSYPYRLPSGPVFERLSLAETHDALMRLMDYRGLRESQRRLREEGVLSGIGLATFVEGSNPSSATYGQGGVSIASRDSCTLKLTATGGVLCAATINEQGQGTATVVAQIAAAGVGVPFDAVRVVLGDTEVTPYGGGNWGSRGTGVGGEAVLLAGRALRQNIVAFVARLRESEPSLLDVRDGRVVETRGGATVMTLEEVARTAYFRTDLVPRDFSPELTVTRSYAQTAFDAVFTNGMQGCRVVVDPETGFVKILGLWIVDDCGNAVNPLLVAEQVRGAAVQGLGGAMFEQCLYDRDGQLLNGSLADYLVPMACEMPDIVVGHVATPTATSSLGAKGAGEGGCAGAPAALMNAINDALWPLGARVSDMPFTPERILQALGKVR